MNHSELPNETEQMANSAVVAGSHMTENCNSRRTKIQRQLTTNISVISAFAVAISGLCAEQALAGGSDCTTGSVVEVCVEWSQQANPEESSDYFVDFTDASNPVVELKTADLAWVVYATLVSNGNPANIGTLGLQDPAPSGEDFEVTIANGAGAGAANVGTINLDDAGFTGYSSIGGGSEITGNLGDLTVQADGGGDGGEVVSFDVGGNVAGDVTVVTLSGSFLVIGEVTSSASITIGSISGGQLWVGCDLSANVTVSGILGPGANVIVIGDVGSTATVEIEDFEGYSGVFFGAGGAGTDFAGVLKLNSGIPGLSSRAHINGGFTGRIDLTNDEVNGTGLHLWEGGSGSIVNGGAVIGTVTLAGSGGTFTFSGDATFDSVSGTIRTLGSSVVTGDINVQNDVSGNIDIGELSGDLEIRGDLTSSGSVTIDGALGSPVSAGIGRVMVTGACDGAIAVAEQTDRLTLIHCLGGLGSGATIEVNTSKGKLDAGGTIHIGPVTYFSLPDITFDGCIRIYNDGVGSGGALTGAITVVGCHALPLEDLNICIDGNDNGNVTIEQDGCSDPVDWSCDTCPTP